MGWVGGWVRRTPVVGHLGRVVPGVRRKAPKSGALSTEYPSRTFDRTSPAVPDPVRQRPHPRRSTPTAAQQRHRQKARHPHAPTPAEIPEVERNPGTQLSQSRAPRRRLSPQRPRRQHTAPRPTPPTEQTELEPDPGTQLSQSRAPRRRLVTPAGTAPTHRSRTNPGHRTDRAGTRPPEPPTPEPWPPS